MSTITINYKEMLVNDVLVLLKANPTLEIEVAVKKTLKATGREILPNIVKTISDRVRRSL